MNVKNIIDLLKTGIPEDKLRIPKRTISAFLRHQLISSMDIIKSNGNYSIEGAVKLRLYSLLRGMGIGFPAIQKIEKKYRADRLYAKELNFHGYKHFATIFSLPIFCTLEEKRYFISIDLKNNEINFLIDEEYMMCLSYGKHMADYIHGRVIFDLWEILETLGFDKPRKTKWMLNSLYKIFEKNQFPIKIWKHHYLQITEYYDKPKNVWQSLIRVMREPHTIMMLQSNNHGYITNIKVTKRKKIEKDTE